MKGEKFELIIDYSKEVRNCYIIDGELFGNTDHKMLVHLHGAAGSDYQRANSLIEDLVGEGICVLALNFSGASDPKKKLIKKASSVQKRMEEAERVIREFVPHPGSSVVWGSSLGGLLALNLAAKFSFEKALLFCPAVYPESILKLPFGNNFSEKLRIESAYKENNLKELFDDFEGKTMFMRGAEDDTVKREHLEEYLNAGDPTRYQDVEIPDCSHSILDFYADYCRSEAGKSILEKMVKFIKS